MHNYALLGPFICWALLGPFICWALLGPFICSTRNRSQMAPNEKVPSNEKMGLRAKHRVKLNLLIVEIVFLQKVWKLEDQCTSIFHFADRPELPYDVDFWRKSFPTENRFSEILTFLDFFGGWFWVFSKRFQWVCRDFGLEPRRQMLLGGQLSFLSNQIN